MAADGALAQAYSHCQEVTKREARNFYFAFLTLPPVKRQAIYAVYAFARICDDIADGDAPTEVKLTGLAEVRRSLERAYAGAPEGPRIHGPGRRGNHLPHRAIKFPGTGGRRRDGHDPEQIRNL